jgi:hypothetical protein
MVLSVVNERHHRQANQNYLDKNVNIYNIIMIKVSIADYSLK